MYYAYQPSRIALLNAVALNSIGDNTVMSVAGPFTGDRYYMYHRNDSTYENFGEFPLDSISIGMKPDNAFFQVTLDMSNDRKHLVVANQDWNIIEIYDNENGRWKVIQGPTPTIAKIVLETNGMVGAYKQRPHYMSWRWVSAGKNEFYVAYDGICLSENTEITNPKSIYSFDYSGNPKKIYHFDSPVSSFAIDDEHGFIYVIQDTPEPNLIRYKTYQSET